MNKWILIGLLFLVGHTTMAKEKVIPFSQLPAKAQIFVKTHFSEKEVASVLLDTEYIVQKEYTVLLKNGTKIEFDGDGEWKEVKAKTTAVPVKITPSTILEHIHHSFPNTYVKEIKRTSRRYEVEISNGLELEFDKNGVFLKIDD